ncbi:MAG: hypothetical protein IJ408_01235 [Clostridia bacterium]|nr:hypothetical protein [Clostridia bacterium]
MKCAFYEKDITPPLYGHILGHGTARVAQDVEDKLYAKAVVFEDGGKYCAILTLDSICVYADFCEKIRDRVCEYTDIPREAIAVVANHTHYGIPMGDTVSERDVEYMAVLERLAADTVILAYKRLEDCTLSYALGKRENVAFVRDYVMSDGRVLTNPSSRLEAKPVKMYNEPDSDLPVLSAVNKDGKLMGVLFTFALHQDTTGKIAYSGDFSSEISERLKDRYGRNFVSVFLPGFCGDVNHLDFIGGKKQNHRTVGKELSEAICEAVSCSKPVTASGIDVKAERITLARRRATAEQLENAKQTVKTDPPNMAWFLLEYEKKAQTLAPTVDVLLQVFVIGDITVILSPFEMYVAYARELKTMTNGKWLMSELANYQYSYVPTKELMGSEVYSVQLCSTSWLEENAGDKIIKAFEKMI